MSPVRAVTESPKGLRGAFTMPDVMFTMRPNLRARIPGSTALIRKTGARRLASRAAIHSACPQSSRFPGGGPALLLTRISGSGQAVRRASRPSSVVTSALTAITDAPVCERISLAVSASRLGSRPLTTTMHPSRASESAHALPRPLDEAQTIALRPLTPKSIIIPLAMLEYPAGSCYTTWKWAGRAFDRLVALGMMPLRNPDLVARQLDQVMPETSTQENKWCFTCSLFLEDY